MKHLITLLLLALGASALAQPRLTVREFLKLSASDTTSYLVTGVVEKVRAALGHDFFTSSD